MNSRIERRGKKGLWQYIATLPGGRSVRRSLHTTDEAAARRLQAEMDATLGAGVRPDPTMTIAAWMEQWIAAEVQMGRAPGTIAAYRASLRLYIGPRIGRVRLDALTVADVQALDADLLRRGGHGGRPLSIRSVRNQHEILSIVLHEAQRQSLLLRNVASLARKPRLPRGYGPEWLTRDQVERLLRAAPGSRWGTMLVVGLYTGLRAGELCGLRWEDIDLQARVMHVRRQRRYENGRGYQLAPPKSDAGERTIPLHETAVMWLSVLRARKTEAVAAGRLETPEWVFCHRLRGQWSPDNPHAASAGIAAIYRAAGLPVPTRPVHALRHTLGRGLAPEQRTTRAAILGHEDPATTDHYTHPDTDDLRQAMDAAGERLRPEQGKERTHG